MEMPDYSKLASAHMFAWKNGLKTGSYYIRSKPVTEATKFSIDIEQINKIKEKRGENIILSVEKKIINDKNFNIEQKNTVPNTDKKNNNSKIDIDNDDGVCINCSA